MKMSGRMVLLSDKSDDEDFGDPAAAERRGLEDSRARLATLFDSGRSQLGGKSVEEALSYSAPKEPSVAKANDAPTDENATAKPVFSSAVYAFVLDGERYQPQGKVGLALMHSTGGKSKLILYLASKKLLCQVVITEDFVVTIKDLYVTFPDQHNRCWSAAFDDQSSLCEFSKTLVAIVGALKPNHSYYVDLRVGDGESVAHGDSVELTTVHFAVDNGVLLTEYRSEESLRLKVGRVKGAELWERALIGMRRHGQRVIAAETSDAAQSLGNDEHSMTVVVVTLKRVKFVDAAKNEVARNARSQTPTSVEQLPLPQSSSLAADVSIANEDTLEEPVSSVVEAKDASGPAIEPEPTKKPTDIRSRMARIGQPLVAMAALPRDIPEVSPTVNEQPLSSAAHSTPSSSSPALSDESAGHTAVQATPVTDQNIAPVTAIAVDSAKSTSVSIADQPQLTHPLPFYFPYGANSTAQGFTFPFVPVPMPSAQPTERLMSDLEERLIAQVKEMQVSFQESLLPLISKTVSDTIATQVSHINAVNENKQSATNGADALLSVLSERIGRLESKVDELHASSTSRPSHSSEDTERRVKRIMSKLYKSVVEAFPNADEGYTAETIRNSLLTLIKEATLSSLEPTSAGVAESDNDVVDAVVKNCVDTVAN